MKSAPFLLLYNHYYLKYFETLQESCWHLYINVHAFFEISKMTAVTMVINQIRKIETLVLAR